MMFFYQGKPTKSEQIIAKFDSNWLSLDACFETILVKKKIALLLQEHLERAQETLHEVFGRSMDVHAVKQSILSLLGSHVDDDLPHKLKCIFTGEECFLRLEKYQAPEEREVSLLIAPPSLQFSSQMAKYKLCDYRKYLEQFHWAQEQGVFDAVRSLNGRIFECSRSNIFLCNKEGIFTPAEQVLPGIYRQILVNKGLVQESNILLDSLGSFDGCFITNSLLQILAVARIGSIRFAESVAYVTDVKKSGIF